LSEEEHSDSSEFVSGFVETLVERFCHTKRSGLVFFALTVQ